VRVSELRSSRHFDHAERVTRHPIMLYFDRTISQKYSHTYIILKCEWVSYDLLVILITQNVSLVTQSCSTLTVPSPTDNSNEPESVCDRRGSNSWPVESDLLSFDTCDCRDSNSQPVEESRSDELSFDTGGITWLRLLPLRFWKDVLCAPPSSLCSTCKDGGGHGEFVCAPSSSLCSTAEILCAPSSSLCSRECLCASSPSLCSTCKDGGGRGCEHHTISRKKFWERERKNVLSEACLCRYLCMCYVCMYVRMYVRVCVRVCLCVCMYVHTYIWFRWYQNPLIIHDAHIHTYLHTYIHAQAIRHFWTSMMHTYKYTYIHTYIQTYPSKTTLSPCVHVIKVCLSAR
jgi:hypothetical protein